MEVTFHCPACRAALPVTADITSTSIVCGGCGRTLDLTFTDCVTNDDEVDRCPLCDGRDFYIRKDFNPQLGLTIVIIGALISAGFYWLEMDLVAYGVLGVAALIDLVVYRRLGDITVCYRCHAEFRGAYRRTAAIFDLHVADELEPEYERQIGLR